MQHLTLSLWISNIIVHFIWTFIKKCILYFYMCIHEALGLCVIKFVNVVIKCFWSSAALTWWIRWVLWGTMLSSGTETFSHPRCRSGRPPCSWRLVGAFNRHRGHMSARRAPRHSQKGHTVCPLPVMNHITRFRLSDFDLWCLKAIHLCTLWLTVWSIE